MVKMVARAQTGPQVAYTVILQNHPQAESGSKPTASCIMATIAAATASSALTEYQRIAAAVNTSTVLMVKSVQSILTPIHLV